MSLPQLEIHIKDGQCKVFEGPARRVYFSTEQAIGLALLRLNPDTVRETGTLRWLDLLADRGIAIATSGDRLLTLMRYPSGPRTIQYRQGSLVENRTVTFPALLMATAFRDEQLVTAQLWVIKAGQEPRLSTTSEERILIGFPYGNVYSHGGICWGTAPIRDLHQPQEVFPAFFNSGFNGDLYEGSRIGGSGLGLRDYLARYDGQAVPLPGETTFTQTVVGVIQGLQRA